ncbi:MAG TPA: XRE family transcriptional regulator [Geobacteraceae bacterium]|nr:XRE family transcriptional regulator [Geobacteraceae bacterium]
MNTSEFQLNSSGSRHVGEKIKQVRQANKLTQKKFAESLGIAQGFLCAIERGRKKPSDTLLIALRHTYAINWQWFCNETGTPGQIPEQEALAAKRLPYKVPLLKGNAVLTENSATYDTEEYVTLPGLPENCFAITYTGDFMAPTIRHGDIVVIAPGGTPTPGNIVLITGQWNEPFLRRCRFKEGEMYFTADNSAYSPFKMNDSTRVLGVVVSVWRRINI